MNYPTIQHGVLENSKLSFDEYCYQNKFCFEFTYNYIKTIIGAINCDYEEALHRHNQWLISSYDSNILTDKIFTKRVETKNEHRQFLLDSIGNYKVLNGDGFRYISESDIETLLTWDMM